LISDDVLREMLVIVGSSKKSDEVLFTAPADTISPKTDVDLQTTALTDHNVELRTTSQSNPNMDLSATAVSTSNADLHPAACQQQFIDNSFAVSQLQCECLCYFMHN